MIDVKRTLHGNASNVNGSVYDEISEGGYCELQLICDDCNKSAYFDDKLDTIVGMIEKLMDRHDCLESTVIQIRHEMTALTTMTKEHQKQHEQHQQFKD